jgi:hypothetical protein
VHQFTRKDGHRLFKEIATMMESEEVREQFGRLDGIDPDYIMMSDLEAASQKDREVDMIVKDILPGFLTNAGGTHIMPIYYSYYNVLS